MFVDLFQHGLVQFLSTFDQQLLPIGITEMFLREFLNDGEEFFHRLLIEMDDGEIHREMFLVRTEKKNGEFGC